MNLGLFALMAGFLLPLALLVSLLGTFAIERHRGLGHPLNLLLVGLCLLVADSVVMLLPSVWTVVSGRSASEALVLLDYARTGWGLAEQALSVAGVLVVDIAMPRITAQLVQVPASSAGPTDRYLLRHCYVLVVCLALALAASVGR